MTFFFAIVERVNGQLAQARSRLGTFLIARNARETQLKLVCRPLCAYEESRFLSMYAHKDPLVVSGMIINASTTDAIKDPQYSLRMS